MTWKKIGVNLYDHCSIFNSGILIVNFDGKFLKLYGHFLLPAAVVSLPSANNKYLRSYNDTKLRYLNKPMCIFNYPNFN